MNTKGIIMNKKSNELEALHVYVQKCKKWELPSLRNQCVQMIKMIDARLYGKPMPVMKLHWWQKLFLRRKRK